MCINYVVGYRHFVILSTDLAIAARLLYVHGVREDTLGGIADGW
jgi:hypothetical protein